MTNTVQVRPLVVAFVLVACSVTPSRAPLGGNYALPEAAPAGDRRARSEAPALPESAASPKVTPVTAPNATVAAVGGGDAGTASALAPVAPADAIHFEPLQVGSQVRADIALSTSFEMHGAPPSMRDAKLSMDSRLRLELKVLKGSSQSLDELEVSLTTLSMHTQFGDHASDNPPEPPETYDITLTGTSATIRARSGSEVDSLERLKLALLVVPLAEFYAHWARSPALELKPGWNNQVPLPFAAALFAASRGESVRLGPLNARFTSHSAPSADVTFELGLPLHYGSGLGNIDFDLTGSAKLNAKTARPTAFELSGPLSATGSSQGAQRSITGSAKFAGTLSYP